MKIQDGEQLETQARYKKLHKEYFVLPLPFKITLKYTQHNYNVHCSQIALAHKFFFVF